MPNTLAHIGLHGVLTRGIIRQSEFHLIYLACILPDIPWIIQRLVETLLPWVDGYQLRLYAVVQASLLMCLVLSAAVAILWVRATRAFFILGLGCLIHLLLDTVEVKWANGVWLFFPFEWQLLQFNRVWPESHFILTITMFGLGYFVFNTRRALAEKVSVALGGARLASAAALLAAYALIPLFALQKARAANIHFAGTLQAAERTGKYVEFDRVPFVADDKGARVKTMGGEWLPVTDVNLSGRGRVSLRGRFADHKLVRASEHQIHNRKLRDSASYVGLALVGLLWTRSLSARIRGEPVEPATR